MPARLLVYVIPNSSRNQVVGFVGDVLKIKITVAPEKGLANKRVVSLLAQTLAVSKASIRVARGQAHTSKMLLIEDLSEDQLALKLKAFRP